MRYQNWDVLVFPYESKVPLQEFKTTCQVIQDPEASVQQPLPTVTSFIPSLPAGAPFRISIHSWQDPGFSDVLGLSNMYQARLLVDGRAVGTKCFDHEELWPSIIDFSVDKNGEFEQLQFPTFHREVLSQSYWNAGDDLGRIKLIISEGVSRENAAFDKVKNVVSFSFQHAPLYVLEASGIAWPNPTMWRQALSPFSAQLVEGPSSRHQTTSMSLNIPVFITQPTYDPFTETKEDA